MPTDFYVATYEFPEPVSAGLRRTDAHCEGRLAETLVFDGKLSHAERAGVEEYLRRNGISRFPLLTRNFCRNFCLYGQAALPIISQRAS